MKIKVKMRIRAVRKSKGMTIAELSSLSGISASFISTAERNYQYPTIYVLCVLAAALEVSPDQLYTYTIKEDPFV